VVAVLQRDAARTRNALLVAAERVVTEHGPAFSLDAVAREAGVSKGGLLHHFRSRDALLVALVGAWTARFDEAVARQLDPDDDRPGRVCRAHIRATFDEPEVGGGPWVHTSVQTAVISVPEVLERARADAERWQRDMLADGLHRQRVLLITRALDGEAMAEVLGGAATVDEDARRELRGLLLALTEEAGPLVAPAGAAPREG
jgi:AcrR family transcriptional regulator